MTLKEWTRYRDLMSQICQKAADEFRDFALKGEGGIGGLDRQTVLEYAYALVQKYGQASGELACMFYEQIAEAQNVIIPPAEMAALPEFGEVAKAVNGAIKQTEKNAPGAVERLTKQVGADTMLQNAKRDGAHFAWITAGDTCAYCMMMSAIGWQKAGKNTLRGNHAEHIHAHCDCQYVVDFKGDLKVEGYDPEGLQKDIMQITDPDGVEYGGDFSVFLNINGRKSMKAKRKGLNTLRRSTGKTSDDKNDTMKLTEQDKAAIMKYKGGDSYRINALLRETVDLSELSNEDQELVSALDEALKKVNTYEGNLIRALDFSDWPNGDERLEDFLRTHEVGNIVTYHQYVSTSKKTGYNDDAGVKLMISNSKKGRDISEFGLDEAEVLYERDCSFRVIKKEHVEGCWYILLEED